MSEVLLSKLTKQNEVIISLLGRLAFKPESVRDMVISRKKQDPERYINGYNACDGNHSLTQIAEIVGVKAPTISPILAEWEEIGIIYEVEKPGGRFYRKLFPI